MRAEHRLSYFLPPEQRDKHNVLEKERKSTMVVKLTNETPTPTVAKLRLAAYIRVSTALDIQENSFDTQERYFTDLIRSNPDWHLVGIYADYATTGTSTEKRIGFQRLMRHCEEGKIDRILCKSLSRFARNTLDALDAIRRLKELGISVYFEKENLDSASIQSEFIFTTLAAIAQEESRNISENLRMAYKQRTANGQTPMMRIFGYRVSCSTKRGPQTVTIDEVEAESVRYMYKAYLDGMTVRQIADSLIDQGKLNIHGKVYWTGAMVRAMLDNEKYAGICCTQKTYVDDYLTHKTKENKGEREQIWIRKHHPAIVDVKTWKLVQKQSAPRHWTGAYAHYPLTRRIHCKCGSNYHRSCGQSRFRWVCGNRLNSIKLCQAEGIHEDSLLESLKPAFTQKFGRDGRLNAKELLIGLKTIQDYDNVERQRVVLKRQISMATDECEKVKLEEQVASQEYLWELLEADRQLRADAIEWLKGMEDRRAETDQLLASLDMNLLRAWFVEGTIDDNTLTGLWLDGSTFEAELIRDAKNETIRDKL